MATTATAEKVFSVSELSQKIKSLLENNFASCALFGEVSNCKLQSSGHLYFTLKDEGAQISAVMFRKEASSLSRIPKDGDKVQVAASLGVYPPHGKYQLIVKELTFQGVGDFLLAFAAIKEKLAAKGYFVKERKKPIPKTPKRIGVVTSPTGAVILDIINILTRRGRCFHLLLNPVRVQGETAASEIAQAIVDFNRHMLADVLIVGRGGGSIEDLWPFNDERVAQAVFESTIPIISAVGHETDFSICDFVADVRAPTPSAAAELVIEETERRFERFSMAKRRIQHTMQQLLSKERGKLIALSRFVVAPERFIHDRAQRLDALACFLEKTMQAIFERQKARLQRCTAVCKAIDPKILMQRGYSICFAEKSGAIISSVCDVSAGDHLRLELCDGKIQTVVL